MSQIRKCCCGVDVHKTFLIACIATFTNGMIKFSKKKRFSTFSKGIREFKEWMRSKNCFEICMESTGKYWVPIYRIVSDVKFHVDIVHPKYVKAPWGKKNDKKDAKRIAEMYLLDHIAEYSIIPSNKILAIRDVCRYRRKTVHTIAAEKNRLTNCLTVSCIKLDEVLSDLFGKTGQALIEQIIERGICNFDPTPYIDSRVKATPEAFELALDGDVTPSTLMKMRTIRNHLDFLEKQKTELEQSMASLSEDFSHQLKLLDSAPGISSISAISIISEIGDNMKVFGSVGKFLSWIGVVPQNNESAGKKKSTRIAKGNSWLKPVIVQCANAAIKDKKHPEIREKYLELRGRRGHKKAIIAIAKRLLTSIYYMLLRDEEYKPNTGKRTAPKKGDIDINRLISYYKSKGFVVTVSGVPVESIKPSVSDELLLAEG